MRQSGIVPFLMFTIWIPFLLTPIGGVIEAREQLLDVLEKEMTELVQKGQPSIVSVAAFCKTPYCDKARRTNVVNTPVPSHTNESLWQTNIGSGCIMDSRGYVLTTENVVHDAQQLVVTISNGERKAAQLIGSDPESNIAVLKVEGKRFAPAKMGDSNLIEVGSWITILGNSFGLTSAVSFGLVNGIREEDDLIQMSAPVNPGNSGAAVLNTKGEVIGLVIATVSEPVTLTIGAPGTQQPQVQKLDLRSQGASLAIPINNAMKIAAELIEHGEYKRGWLGVSIQDLNREQAENLNVKSGVLVTRVLNPSPAATANLLEGDVIVEYDGRRVTEGKKLLQWVQSSEVGKIVEVVVSRKGSERVALTEIVQRPKDLMERISEATDTSQYDPSSTQGTPSQHTSSSESIEKRIELLEEEIKSLRTLIHKEK